MNLCTGPDTKFPVSSPPNARSNVSDSDPTQGEEPATRSLLRYVTIIRRRLWIVLAIMAIGVTATVLYTLRQPKVYAATATVVVNPQAPRVLGADQESVIELGTNSYWSNQEFYNTQVDIITGFPMARATVAKTFGEIEFYELLMPKAMAPTMTEQERLDRAAEIFKGMLAAAQNRESRVISITVQHTDKELARALANEHVLSYLAATLAKRTHGADKSSKFLATELDAAEFALRESEQKVYEFKAKNDIISVSLEDKQSILAADIARYSGALSDNRIKRIELGALRKRAQAAKGDEVLESPVFALASNAAQVELLKQTYVEQKQKFLEVQEQFGPKSTPYLEQQKKVADLYAQIQGEARRALRELEETYQAALSAETGLTSEVQRLKEEALALGPLAVDYGRLVRKQKSDEENYNRLIGRLQTSEQEARNEQTNVDEHEYARAAVKVYPRMKLNVAVSILLSMLLGVSLAFLLDYLDRTIKNAEDVEAAAGAPLLGVIPVVADVPTGDDPRAQRERDLYVFANPTSRAAECCRSIRTNILFSSADRPMKVITVSSPRPREGKTTTTIYMGTTMAQSGQRILLIDTDLRRPRLHKSLGVSKNRGLTNLILGDAEIDDVVKSTDIPNLFVLPCGPQPPNPAELLLTNKFKQVLADLASRYDRILLDSPPVLAVTDAVVLSRLSDGVMLIAQAGKTLLDDVTRAARQFHDVDATILGVIMNDMDISDRRYGGYYYYAYGSYGETAKGEA